MTDLKTLKDLELPIGSFIGSSSGKYMVVDLKELKAEAVKWVKKTASSRFYTEDVQNVAIKEWIKDFFNLTEDDLK